MGYPGEFELLTMLAIAQLAGEAYGVTIREVLETRTSRAVTLGAIYKTLGRLEAKGLLDVTVFFLGWHARDHIHAYYREADVFVLASDYEGMPNVVLEAMASSCAIVASDGKVAAGPGSGVFLAQQRSLAWCRA